MAFNIKVYAGTANGFVDLFNKIVAGMKTVYGYTITTGHEIGDGWGVKDISGSNTWFALLSKGSDKLDDMVYTIKGSSSGIVISGYQHLSGSDLTTFGIRGGSNGAAYFGTMGIYKGLEDFQFWMYGNDDFIHIVYRGYGIMRNNNGRDTSCHIVSFGKYIPTYNPSITHVSGVDALLIGSDVIIPVNDASIFEPNRYVIISSGLTWEKTLVTEVSYTGNTIKVSNISQDHKVVDKSPIIIGEICKPYYIWGTNQDNDVQGVPGKTIHNAMLMSRISGSLVAVNAQNAIDHGFGVLCTIFQEVGILSNYSALDMLNYDRYMFELYIYSSVFGEQGFYGKLPYIYAVGANDVNSESTIINDQYFLYRIFVDYGFLRGNYKSALAIRESYK